MNNNSLKEYYIQLHKLSQNNTKLMNAITESFNSYSPEVILKLDDEDQTTIHIPSFLYLENKIEELESSFNYLFNLPKNGEAWFTKDSNMYKLNLIHSNLLPQTPSIEYNPNNAFNIEDNNFLKDLIFPKTSLRLDISNLTNNIHKVLVKKIVLYNNGLINDIFSNDSLISYSDYKEKLYLSTKNVDYDEYDLELEVPTHEINYESKFDILSIKDGYPRYNNSNELIYRIRVNTLYYSNINDKSITYKLKEGDYLSLSSYYNIFRINKVEQYINYETGSNSNHFDDGTNKEYIIELVEINGHVTLTDITTNSDMYFVLYTDNMDLGDKYVDVPINNDPYIILFISSIYNNVKSNWSDGIKINLNDIYITDNNSQISYVDYFNKYCINIGNIINNIAQFIYVQPNEYTKEQLRELTTGKTIQELVTNTLYKEDEEVVNITVLNDHLVDDEISNNLARLHKQKIEITNNLNNINNNIDDTFNQLTNTDFTQDTSITQTFLKSKLDSYYTERLTQQQQLIAIINNIDLIKNDVIGFDSLKYRIRGVTNAYDNDELGTDTNICSYLKENFGPQCQLIGLEVEYKYKNIHSNSTTVENNSNTIFTDWVRVNNIDKQRYLKFDNITNNYSIEYVNYDTNANIIKWNQIDIPIQSGEDVVIRIRYKYNIGQPFINLYTPWSNNITVSYTPEHTGSVIDIATILKSNESDLNNSKFIAELINGGYQEHITNKIVDNSQVYYHMPENIYSGFNTAENKFISLKDKLTSIDKEINEYKEYINNELSSEYKVFLQDDKEQLIELTKNTVNTINFQYDNDNYDTFIRKEFNLIIKNTGSVPINFYSIFPGNTDIPLIHSNINHYIYNRNIEDYERVPLLLDNVTNVKESVFPQVLGQWIYFRYNNIYTKEYLYYVNSIQNTLDSSALIGGEQLSFNTHIYKNFIGSNNNQMLLGFRNREYQSDSLTWNILNIDYSSNTLSYDNSNDSSISNTNNYFDDQNISKFIYDNSILKYEHISYISAEDNSENFFDKDVSITYEFTQNPQLLSNIGFNSIDDIYGMFLIPNLLNKSQIVCDTDKNNQYKKLNAGESLSIPILCEYFMDNKSNNDIYKTIAFSLQTSLTKDIDNYIFKVVLSNKLKYNSAQKEIYIPLVSSEIF